MAGNCLVEIQSDGKILIWPGRTVDLGKLAEQAVAYSYRNKTEYFHAGANVAEVEKVVIGCASIFAVPTFGELKDALEHYGTDMIRYFLPDLCRRWYETNRIFFKKKPEKVMRNSLTQYLKSQLRGNVEVRPEQIVDSTHPVDIKVTWYLSNRIALIEIKWLGKSRTSVKITKEYTQVRAREGAKQLVDYWEMNRV